MFFAKEKLIQRIDTIHDRIENQAKWMRELTKSIDSLKSKNQVFSSKIEKLEEAYDQLNEKMDELENQIQELRNNDSTLRQNYTHNINNLVDTFENVNKFLSEMTAKLKYYNLSVDDFGICDLDDPMMNVYREDS